MTYVNEPDDLHRARFWATRAGDQITIEERLAYTRIAEVWAYIAWVQDQRPYPGAGT